MRITPSATEAEKNTPSSVSKWRFDLSLMIEMAVATSKT